MVYPIVKLTLPLVYKLWLRKVHGIENLPKDGPFILAANHMSYYDAGLLHAIILPKINKKIHALVNSDYWNNPLNKYFLNLGECIPVFFNKRSSKKKNEKSIKKAITYLKNKDIVQVFPEGGRSYDGKLKKAYNGVARLALTAEVPVLPIGIIGSNNVIPKGKIFPRFTRCEVKIGNLIQFEKYYGKNVSEAVLEKLTRKVMKQIATLINQKYNF